MNWLIIPAAGIGSRMQQKIPKQYLKLHNGMTILEATLKRMLDCQLFDKAVIALNQNDNYWNKLAIASDKRVITCIGGKTRSESVLNALLSIESKIDNKDWVMVHDASRVCITKEDVLNLYNQVIDNDAEGGILSLPVYETVKKSNDFGTNIDKTIDRKDLWLAQTPQMFTYQLLKNSLEFCNDNNIIVTDEASAVESLGVKPLLVLGKKTNIKITVPEDLGLANYFYSLC